jgi:hypothetical protein
VAANSHSQPFLGSKPPSLPRASATTDLHIVPPELESRQRGSRVTTWRLSVVPKYRLSWRREHVDSGLHIFGVESIRIRIAIVRYVRSRLCNLRWSCSGRTASSKQFRGIRRDFRSQCLDLYCDYLCHDIRQKQSTSPECGEYLVSWSKDSERIPKIKRRLTRFVLCKQLARLTG